jgi:YVTN family beta-propeller protein
MEKRHEVSCTLIIILVATVALLYCTFLGNQAYAIKSPIHQEFNSAINNKNGNCVTNIDQVPVGNLPIRIAYDSVNNRVYVANALSDTVSVIDACTLKVISTISTQNNPFGIAYDSVNNRVYVANQASDSVSLINAATLKVVDTVSGDGIFILDNLLRGLDTC